MSDLTAASVSVIKHLLQEADTAERRNLVRQLADDDRPGVVSAVATARRHLARTEAEEERLRHLYATEDALRQEGVLVVAGLDEVGRGAIAGPLSAGACVLPPTPRLRGLNDSKKLSPAQRCELDARIREIAIGCAVGHVDAHDVDSLGVTAALRLAMNRALDGLGAAPDHLVVDGHPMGISRCETAIVKGDSLVAAISAASIVAKVARDALMCRHAAQFPAYGFDVNKGYGTSEHFDAIRTHGFSPLHRRTFCRRIDEATLF